MKKILEGFISRRNEFKAKTGIDWRYMSSSVVIDTITGKVSKLSRADVEVALKQYEKLVCKGETV